MKHVGESLTFHLNRAMASSSSDFGEWLCGVLEAAGADGEVYGGYISGSLATMEGATREEICENVQEILSGCVVRC